MSRTICMLLCIVCVALTECKSTKPLAVNVLTTAGISKDTATIAPVTKSPADDMATAIANGQAVFQSKCYQCHDLPRVTDYSQSDWSDIMVKMSRKAHLSDSETNQVLAFVNSQAKK